MTKSAETATQASINAALDEVFLAIKAVTWRGAVIYRLSRGYSDEDIARQLNCNVEDVRFLVRALDAHGKLDDIYEGAFA